MKRFITAAVVLSLAALPGTAIARHGHHHAKRHHHHHLVVKGKSGTVTAWDATTGELTITTNKGRQLSALVTDDTRLRFETADATPTAVASHHGGGDDNSGPGNGGDDNSGSGNSGDDDQGDDHGNDAGDHDQGDDHGDDNGNHDQGDDHGDDNGNHDQGDDHGDDNATGTDVIAVGDGVRRARIDLDGDDAVWTKLTIIKAASSS